MTDPWLQQQRGHRLVSLIYYGRPSQELYDSIAELVQKVGTPNLSVYYPQIHYDHHIRPVYTTPLIAAILRRKDPETMVQVLIEGLRADPNFTSEAVYGSPLDYAVTRRDDALIHQLMNYGGKSVQPMSSGDADFLRDVIRHIPGGAGYQEAASHFHAARQQLVTSTTIAE